jgi:hypothetical protein
MWKAVCGLFIYMIMVSVPAIAQRTDSLKRAADSLKRSENLRMADSLRKADSIRRDRIKIDTNLINRYRIQPSQNILPQVTDPLRLQVEQIPVTMLDYKVSYWRKSVIFGVNFNQAGFSDNWAGGGVNSFALGSNVDIKLDYNKAPFSYTTELILQYGRSKNRGQQPRKNNDRIFWDNKIASQLSKSWYFFGSLNFQSQFDKGFQYDANNINPPLLISRFMSPGYVTESIGFEYKPNNVFDLRIGTGTARQTFVLDTTIARNLPANYGVNRGYTFKNEIAFQVVALYDKEIMQNLRLTSRYAGFIPYGRHLKNIDHRLDVTIAAKVNRLIAVTITGVALLDKDTDPKIQGNETLALGVIYRFP